MLLARLASSTIIIALLSSTNVFADTFGKQTVYAEGTIRTWTYLVSEEVASIGTVQRSAIYGEADSFFYRCSSKYYCQYEIAINEYTISCGNSSPIVRLRVGSDWFKYKSLCFETGENEITYIIVSDDDLNKSILENNTKITLLDNANEDVGVKEFSLNGARIAMNVFEEGMNKKWGYRNDSLIESKNENEIPDTSESTVVEVTANSREDANNSINSASNVFNTTTPYYLQAGAFTNIQDAYDRRNILNHLGINAFLAEAEIDGQKWHRVRFGPFNDSQSLNNAKNRLGEIGISYFVVRPETLE